MRFFLTTLGCKVNQYEIQVIREAWEGLGHSCVADVRQAEAILVHSCAVTSKALADLRKTVAGLRRAAPASRIMVSGCAAQIHGQDLFALAGVVRILGTAHRELILAGPDVLLSGLEAETSITGRPFVLEGIGEYPRARAQVKIQDGCSHGCTYCIVPLARGRPQSREPHAIMEEIQRLLAAGFREISLTGINLRLYGYDLAPGMDCWDLIRLLEQTFAPQWAGRARFRMSSLDPAMLDAKALDALAASRMLCPHLHLSLQSGSPAVLRRMGRGHYAPEALPPFCRELARNWPLFGLGADLLAGFPGEKDENFQETMALAADLPLSYAHVFPYSARPGTPAAAWPDQVPEVLRRQRAKALRDLAVRKKEAFLEKMAGRTELCMVVEGLDPVRGKCEFYVDCRVEGKQGGISPRGLLRVRPRCVASGIVMCETQ